MRNYKLVRFVMVIHTAVIYELCCVFLELKSKDLELEAMKKQAESTNREYDRLTSEFQELQVKCRKCTLWYFSLRNFYLPYS